MFNIFKPAIKKTLDTVRANTARVNIMNDALNKMDANKMSQFMQEYRTLSKDGASNIKSADLNNLASKHLDGYGDMSKSEQNIVKQALRNDGLGYMAQETNSDDVIKKYFADEAKRKTNAGKAFTNKDGFRIVNDDGNFTADSTFFDKVKTVANPGVLKTFYSAGDAGGSKAVMAKRAGATVIGANGVMDAVQLLSGERSLLSEKGQTDIPVVPFL